MCIRDSSKTEVNQQIANLVDSAPTTLNTLNELALALGNDKNFSTTVTASIGTKQPLLTKYSGSLPILDTTHNKIRQLFTTSPINSSIYNNSSNAFDQNNGNIMLSLDGSYLNNVYTKSDSDLRYPVKAIDGTNTNISLDTKYRIQPDGTNFYIQDLMTG